ncbi:hypothetical protein [Staphylospora marina]|uniref:YkvI family membrane protein n=1 Tax=Staphylospora marina TaxID=2490858 RepID=UPI000F5BFC83|nr:hypothetical protein [Staphylospora marina]
MKGSWSAAVRIGFTFMGTVVGAGFASGQEILTFFTGFGPAGAWGIVIASLLFGWLGTRMMRMGARLDAQSYEEFNDYLFGGRLGGWMTVWTGVMLFGVTTAMMSGTGSLFREQLGLPFHLGVAGTALLAFWVIVRGMSGILAVNSIVVPAMILFTVLAAVHAWTADGEAFAGVADPVRTGGHWLLSATAYVAFNLASAQAVLVPLGAQIKDERTLRLGGWLGGLGLGAMLLASHFALGLYFAEASVMEIPMARVIRALGEGIRLFFLGVLWAEIFTTLVGNVYGLTAGLSGMAGWSRQASAIAVFAAGYLLSLIGFPVLVRFLYPLFGYFGLVLLMMLIFRRLPPPWKPVGKEGSG